MDILKTDHFRNSCPFFEEFHNINFTFFLTVIINILHNYGDVIEKVYK